jgi:hypothetical protein
MTLTEHTELIEELKNAKPKSEDKLMPSDIKDKLSDKIEDGAEVKNLEFDETTGRYTATTQEDYRFRICAVCGHTQPDNIQAMKIVAPNLVQDLKQEYKQEEFIDKDGEFIGTEEEVEERVEGDLCQWHNHKCEQRHPPYRSTA